MREDSFLHPLLEGVPNGRSIHLRKEQDTHMHSQTITPCMHCLTCLFHPRNGRCLVPNKPLDTVTGNCHLSKAILPHNDVSSLTLKNVEFEGEQNQSKNHDNNAYHNGYARICRVQPRKEAPQTHQESTWADLGRSNYTACQQEHDNGESDCRQAQDDHKNAIKDIHN